MDYKLLMTETKAIWLRGLQHEVNVQAGFTADIEAQRDGKYILLLSGATLYRVFVNGVFIHYGPARSPYGYMFFDQLDLSRHIHQGVNKIAIEAAGYNCNSYYGINNPSFIKAAVLENDSVIASTGENGQFKGIDLIQREQRVSRYSYQRYFTEIYYLDNYTPLTNWTTREDEMIRHSVEEVPADYCFLERGLPVPAFHFRPFSSIVETGHTEHAETEKYIENEMLRDAGTGWITGFKREEIGDRPLYTLQDLNFKRQEPPKEIQDVMQKDEYILLDMGLNNNGFIHISVTAHDDAEMYLLFDEKLIEGKIDFKAIEGTENTVKYVLASNEKKYELQTFESYGFKYIYVAVLKGSVTIDSLGLIEYSYPHYSNTKVLFDDKQLTAVYHAAVETYRQNTLDVFMDCPVRERAGWLCDSYFTAQAAQYFTGDTLVESRFLDNYQMTKEFKYLPKGMLPMIYPGEDPGGQYIPQWAMWYIIQLEQYLKRNHDDKEKYRKLVYDLLHYFNQFLNEDGLLEKLEGWNFLEWSDANQWTQDVNYPTNMLYTRILRIAGALYEDDDLTKQSSQLKEKIISMSFDGNYFIDNAVRDSEGNLKNTGNRSEVCQYYAFFTGVADGDASKFGTLRNMIVNVFGPKRKEMELLPEIAYANAFIGYYLRMEVLLQWGCFSQVIDEIKGYFYKMADRTGTLWENDGLYGSQNHGFASYAGVVIIKAIFGVLDIDNVQNTVSLVFHDIGLKALGGKVSCTVGTPNGNIVVMRKEVMEEEIIVVHLPKQYKANVQSHEKCKVSFI